MPGNADVIRDNNQQIVRVKVIRMLAVVVIVFAVFWLPLQTFSLIMWLYPEIRQGFVYKSASFNIFVATYFVCHWLSMAHSCLNPLIYCFMNDNFKSDLKSVCLQAIPGVAVQANGVAGAGCIGNSARNHHQPAQSQTTTYTTIANNNQQHHQQLTVHYNQQQQHQQQRSLHSPSHSHLGLSSHNTINGGLRGGLSGHAMVSSHGQQLNGCSSTSGSNITIVQQPDCPAHHQTNHLTNFVTSDVNIVKMKLESRSHLDGTNNGDAINI